MAHTFAGILWGELLVGTLFWSRTLFYEMIGGKPDGWGHLFSENFYAWETPFQWEILG